MLNTCNILLCSCLFLPSLATVKGVTADSVSTGGIGGGKSPYFIIADLCMILNNCLISSLSYFRLQKFSTYSWSFIYLLVPDQQVQFSLRFPPNPLTVCGSPHVPHWTTVHLFVHLLLSLWRLSGNIYRGGSINISRWEYCLFLVWT